MNQEDILKKMTAEERMNQAFELSELTLELAKANIKSQLGRQATKKRIHEELKKRLNS